MINMQPPFIVALRALLDIVPVLILFYILLFAASVFLCVMLIGCALNLRKSKILAADDFQSRSTVGAPYTLRGVDSLFDDPCAIHYMATRLMPV
jgi:hypothetical protein